MSILSYISLGLVIDVVIFVILYMRGRNRKIQSHSEYLQKYDSIGPYSSSDLHKYM
jgi:hypothetical protein